MFDKFMNRHIGVTNSADLAEMLKVIGVESVEELISQVIPASIRLKKPIALPTEGMQVNSLPAQNQWQGKAWIRTQTCELPWHSAELHRWASLLPTDSQNCADISCGHRTCVS